MHKNPRFPFSKSGTAFKLPWFPGNSRFTENLELPKHKNLE